MILRDILIEHGIEQAPEGHRHSTRNRVQIDCPFCGPDSQEYHLGIHETRLYANCWKCGRLSLAWVLANLTKRTLTEWRSDLTDLKTDYSITTTKIKGKLKRPKGVAPIAHCHKQYLRSRGFDSKKLVRLWNLLGTNQVSSMPWRIYIPVILEGKEVSWTTRLIHDKGLRYQSASLLDEAYPHKSTLYGEDYCRHSIIVHEGPTDVWRTGPGSVATYGADHTSDQILRMSKYPKRVICFDNEPEAQKRARAICKTLQAYPGQTLNVQLDAKDPGSAKPKETKALRQLLN